MGLIRLIIAKTGLALAFSDSVRDACCNTHDVRQTVKIISYIYLLDRYLNEQNERRLTVPWLGQAAWCAAAPSQPCLRHL